MNRLQRFWDSDLAWSWRHTPTAMFATVVSVLLFLGAFGAPWLAPHNPFDLASIDLFDALLPPAWDADGKMTYLLGPTVRDVIYSLHCSMALESPYSSVSPQ